MRLQPVVLWVALAAGALPRAMSAQEPARRWERPGFEFSRDGVWRKRARAVRAARQAALARGDLRSLNAPLDARRRALAAPGAPSTTAMAVGGTLRAPAFLVAYANTAAPPFPAPQYQDALFGDSAAIAAFGRPFSLRTFYEQLSNGLFSVQGQVVGWTTLDTTDTYYEGVCNGLGCSSDHVAQLLAEAVQKNDAAVDYRQFDGDGDGFVDIAIVIQPEVGAECRGVVSGAASNIWSHRWSMSGRGRAPIATNDSGPSGFVRVNDYIIQPAVGGSTACDGAQIMPPGTVAHELGHGLDLPDLYDTWPYDDDWSEGIGAWGLMSSGNYDRPDSPAHMEGFSRLLLGWVTVVDVATDGTDTLGPYATADTIFRVTPPGANPRGEYFLLENRQGVLGDTALTTRRGSGLLIFHVDMQQYNAWVGLNRVNSGSVHALWLLQADGLNELRSSACAGVTCRGDPGDPFPGTAGVTALGYSSVPNNRLNAASAFPGFGIDSITQLSPAGPMRFRIVFPAPLVAADTALGPGVMGAAYADTLSVTGGGAGTYTFSVTGASLPPGIALSASGVFSGIATFAGTFDFTVGVVSNGTGVTLPLRIVVATPQLGLQAVADQLLRGGTNLTADEQRYMDFAGNRNNRYDVGDVAAWLDRNPSLAPATALRRLVRGVR